MADSGHGTSPDDVRSVSQIIEDYENQDAEGKESIGTKIKNTFSSVAKSTGKKVKAVDTASSAVSEAVTNGVASAVLGDDAKSFSFMNSKGGGVVKTVAGIAATAVGGKLIAGMFDKSDEAEADNNTEKQESVSVPSKANLDNQQKIIEENKAKGRDSKYLTYTDEQIDKMSDNDLAKLSSHPMFAENPQNATLFEFGKNLFEQEFGKLAGVAVQAAQGVSKVLTDNKPHEEDFGVEFTEDTLAEAFSDSQPAEEQTPDISTVYEEEPETVEPEESAEDIIARRAAMADEIAPSEPASDMEYQFE